MGATYRPQHVGEVTLEEPFHSFILHDLLPTVHSSLVHLLLLPAHHHEPPPHCVEGVGHCHRPSSHCLSYGKSEKYTWVVPSKLFGRVIGTKVDGSVDDDSLHGGDESGVEPSHHPISFETFDNTVSQALKLSLSSTFTHISTQPGPGEVKRINNSKD